MCLKIRKTLVAIMMALKTKGPPPRQFVVILITGLIATLLFVLYRAGGPNGTDLRTHYLDQMAVVNHYYRLPKMMRLEEITEAAVKPQPGRSIFFHDASFHQFASSSFRTLYLNKNPLTVYQACAIESAAKHNPNYGVFVLFASPVYTVNGSESAILRALAEYPNVHLRNVNLWAYALDTPLYEWMLKGFIFKAKYMISHLTNLLRYMSLWHYGGITLNMNVLVLRSLETLEPNYLSTQNAERLSVGILSLSPEDLGHSTAALLLNNFPLSALNGSYETTGRQLLEETIGDWEICNTDHVIDMWNQTRCKGFKVYDAKYFCPYDANNAYRYFYQSYTEEVSDKLQDAYMIYLADHLTYGPPIVVNLDSPYIKLAKGHCPHVYRLIKQMLND